MESSGHGLSLEKLGCLRPALHHHLLHVVGAAATKALHLRGAGFGSRAACPRTNARSGPTMVSGDAADTRARGMACGAGASCALVAVAAQWADASTARDVCAAAGGLERRRAGDARHLAASWRGDWRHRRRTPARPACRASSCLPRQSVPCPRLSLPFARIQSQLRTCGYVEQFVGAEIVRGLKVTLRPPGMQRRMAQGVMLGAWLCALLSATAADASTPKLASGLALSLRKAGASSWSRISSLSLFPR
jgi:hypothetical protein